MSAIREKIEARLDELEALMKARNYAGAAELLPSITKFASVLTEEQRDCIGAARLAIAENLYWTAYFSTGGSPMSTWHRAKIKFQYSPKGIPSHRVTNSVTTQVYGNTESAALQALRKMYPSWQDFVILEINWQI